MTNLPDDRDTRQQQLRHLLAALAALAAVRRNEFVARAARARDPRDAVRAAADPAHDRRPRRHLHSREWAAAERAAQGLDASPADVVRAEWPTARWLAWMRLPGIFRARTRSLGYLNPGRWLAFLLTGGTAARAGLHRAVDDRTQAELDDALEVDRGRGRTSANAANVRRAREEVSLEELPDGEPVDAGPADGWADGRAELDLLRGRLPRDQRQAKRLLALLRDEPALYADREELARRLGVTRGRVDQLVSTVTALAQGGHPGR